MICEVVSLWLVGGLVSGLVCGLVGGLVGGLASAARLRDKGVLEELIGRPSTLDVTSEAWQVSIQVLKTLML